MEILFYHLQISTLEQALPLLLEKTLQRGWKAVVKVSSPERLKALDDHLWTYRDDSFLPHAIVESTGASESNLPPILLTTTDERYQNAEVVFAVDGADLPQSEGWLRTVLMFDGNDPESLEKARQAWKTLKAANREATYWRQSADGKWEKAA